MGKNLKYGEFTFSAPKARPTVAGYAHGGKVAMKKGSESKSVVKSAKLVGMKMEPEGMVKKEVALLKKAGAPAKLIKHEEREGALMGLKKGGKTRYAEGGDVDERDLTPTEKAVGRANYKLEKHKKYKSDKYPEGRDNVVSRESPFDRKTVDMPGDFQGNTIRTPLSDRIIKSGDKYDPMFRFKKFSEDAGEMIREKQADRYYKKGGKVGYAEGGGAQSDKELAVKEDARADKALRDQQKGYKDHYKREEAENRADRKAAQDALMYIPRKIGQGAKSAYDAVMGKKKGGEVHSDVAMDKKVIGKAVHKHEAAMHPGKPMTKLKKGGDVKGYALGGMPANPGAPMAGGQNLSPRGAVTGGGRPGAPNPNAIDVKPMPAGLQQQVQPQFVNPRGATTGGGRPGMVNPNAIDVKPTPGSPSLSPRGAVTGGPRPGMVNTNAVRPTTPMKKGGAAKKGVPTFNRNPKC